MTRTLSPGRLIVLLIGLAMTLIPPSFGFSRLGGYIPGLDPMVAREAVWWALVALVLLYVIVVERRPLASIGLTRPTWKTFAFGFGGAVAVLAIGGGCVYLAMSQFHLTQNETAYRQLAATPYLFRIALVTRAAVAEELLFRGYGIERLQELTASKLLAGLVTLALFTFAHLAYWGWVQLIFAGTAGLVLTLLYLWRRDLASNMIAHWLTDAVGFLLPH